MRRSALVWEVHPARCWREDSLDCQISWSQYDNYLEKCKINLTKVSMFGGKSEEKAGAEEPHRSRGIARGKQQRFFLTTDSRMGLPDKAHHNGDLPIRGDLPLRSGDAGTSGASGKQAPAEARRRRGAAAKLI